ncbi:MAG: hypothetical protein ACJ8J0_12805 [Longimicrobiaceae bacterium]
MTAVRFDPCSMRGRGATELRALLLVLAALGILAGRPEGAAGQARVREYTRPIVLVVRPDSAQLAQLRRRLGDEAFYVTADDASFYQARAFEVLDSLRVPCEAVAAARIRFRVGGVMKEYTWGGPDAAWWFVLLYDGESEPRISAGADLDLAAVIRAMPRLRGAAPP